MIYSLKENYKDMFHNAVNNGIEYLDEYSKINSFIIGVSGGIDSALVCAIAREICDTYLNRDITLYGYSLPIYSKDEEMTRAKEIGVLCHEFKETSLHPQYSVMCQTEGLCEGKTRQGNMKARLRMMFLYDKASEFNGLVLSTDNLTEYYTGFWTLHGDVGDLGLIQNLWKTEVYGVARYYTEHYSNILKDCIQAIPTDGLGMASESDIDQLLPGWEDSHEEAYKYIDKSLINHMNNFIVDDRIVKRYRDTMFKRSNAFNISRENLVFQEKVF